MRFARKPATRPSLYPAFGGTFDVEGYIHYHGAALVRRFDANSYLYLTRAMDLYDLGRDGGEEHWLEQDRGADAAGRHPQRLALPAGRDLRVRRARGRRPARTPNMPSSTRRTGTTPSSRNGIS